MRAVQALGALGALFFCVTAAAAVPDGLQVQGQLLGSSGVAVSGTYDLEVRLFPAQTGGAAVLSKTFPDIEVGTGGVFDVQIAPAAAAVLGASGPLWLEVAVQGEPPLPRTPLLAAPYAFSAQRADVAADLACSGCVAAAEVSFAYAGAATKGGAAADLDCPACVDAADLAGGAVGALHIQGGAVTAAKLGVSWAAGVTPGGAATDLACSGCVGSGDVAANLSLGGTVTVGQSVVACGDGASGTCGLKIGASSWIGGAQAQVQSQGLLVRSADGSAWAPLTAGATTIQGGLTAGTAGVGAAAPGTGLLVVGAGSGTDPVLEARAGSARLWVQHDGRTGIGTASPQALLHVAGTARFDGPVSGLRLAPTTGATCGSGTEGAITYDSGTKTFFGCDGAQWVPLSGGSVGAPAPKSCSAIKLADPGAASGAYTINPTGANGKTVQVYCDMTTEGGGWTLVAQRNQYGSFNSAWTTAEMGVGDLANWQPSTDLGTARLASLDVNGYMAASGDAVLRVEKIHPTAPTTAMTFEWPLRTTNLTYNPSPVRMFWYGSRFWCSGNGANCKGHGGLSNGWDISNSTSTNQWLTYYPAEFQHDTPFGTAVGYNTGGVAWIYIWARSASVGGGAGSYKSCKAILDAGQSTGNGVYTIVPYDEPNMPVQVFCDMSGGGWTLVAQRNQYSSFHAGFSVQDINLGVLGTYQPDTDLGALRLSSLNVNRFMAGTGAAVVRVHKRHPTGSTFLDFAWGSRSADVLYTPSGTRMFWYASRYWCTGDGATCKGHGGLSNGWDISTVAATNDWLTYYPGSFQIGTASAAQVNYGQSGVAWIYLWAR